MMGPFEPGIGPVRLKTDPCRSDGGPPEHVNCLFSLNFDSERLQYIIVQIENGPLGEGGEISPLSPPPPGCATEQMMHKRQGGDFVGKLHYFVHICQ